MRIEYIFEQTRVHESWIKLFPKREQSTPSNCLQKLYKIQTAILSRKISVFFRDQLNHRGKYVTNFSRKCQL